MKKPNLYSLIILLGMVLLFTVTATFSTRAEPDENGLQNILVKTPWKSEPANLFSPVGEITSIDAKKTMVMFKGRFESPIVVFINPKTGNTWAGREANFYFETDTEIIGGWLGGNMLQWYKSFIPKIKNGERLEDVANRFGANIDSKMFQDSEPATDLRPVLSISFFNRFENSSAPGIAKVTKSQIKDGILQMDLESSWGPKASVWISLDTRKILKAIENGKQTFPKTDVFANRAANKPERSIS